jgi:hypothetical protein
LIGVRAGEQFGRIHWRQLREVVGEATITEWAATGYLWKKLPSVYAVGHVAPSVEADLWTAVLYAGPGAAISDGTAAWWRGWLKDPLPEIHVRTPRRCSSVPELGITVHARRTVERELVRGVPTTTVPHTMLALAAMNRRLWVRIALAELDYRGELVISDLMEICGSGRKGSGLLRWAIARHMPELARTRSELEIKFLLFCEAYGIPIPLTNRVLYGVRADFWWPQFNLVVFVDGTVHVLPERMRRDRTDELTLRSHGLAVTRYDVGLIDRKPLAVHADLVGRMADAA